jgi:hypothetical protein
VTDQASKVSHVGIIRLISRALAGQSVFRRMQSLSDDANAAKKPRKSLILLIGAPEGTRTRVFALLRLPFMRHRGTVCRVSACYFSPCHQSELRRDGQRAIRLAMVQQTALSDNRWWRIFT